MFRQLIGNRNFGDKRLNYYNNQRVPSQLSDWLEIVGSALNPVQIRQYAEQLDSFSVHNHYSA